jgi:dUTPase
LPISSRSVYKHEDELQFLYLVGQLKIQMNRNLVGSIYDRSSMKIAHFASIRLQTWPHRKFLFLVGQLKTYSLLKPLGLIKQTFTGSIYYVLWNTFYKMFSYHLERTKNDHHKQFMFLIVWNLKAQIKGSA